MASEKLWFLAQIIVGVLSFVLSVLFLNKETKEQKITISAILGVTVFVATILIEIKIEYLDKLLDFQRDESSFELAKKYSDANKEVSTSKSILFKEIFQSKIKNFNDDIKWATEKKVRIESHDLYLFATKIITYAPAKSTIKATSYVSPDDWWKKEWGKNYLLENYKIIKERECTIERIFLVQNDQEFERIRDLMVQQKRNNVVVYYCFTSDLNSYRIKEDIIVVGDDLAGKLYLGENRTTDYVEFYKSEEDIREVEATFDILKSYSHKF